MVARKTPSRQPDAQPDPSEGDDPIFNAAEAGEILSIWWNDLRVAAEFLTRVPLGASEKRVQGAVAASMVAYLAAQLVDVHMFHFWKRLTGGRHLWLRNNGSTLVSQLVDTVAVILITHFYAHALPIDADADLWPQLFTFIASGYVFKAACAAIDTVPFYFGVRRLGAWLEIDPNAELEPSEETNAPAIPD